jgi:hypothetical protein
MKHGTKFIHTKSLEHREIEFRDIYLELCEACEIYDEGSRDKLRKFRNIAGALYILLHDGSKQKSLLRAIGVRDRLLFPDSASVFQAESFGLPLASIFCPSDPGDRIVFRARKEECLPATRKPYKKWWNGLIFSPDDRLRLSRSTLVNVMRSQDAGFGHSDDHLRDEAYCYLEQRGAPKLSWYISNRGWMLDAGGNQLHIVSDIPIKGEKSPSILSGPYKIFLGPQATVRQIAWELDVALRESGALEDLGL